MASTDDAMAVVDFALLKADEAVGRGDWGEAHRQLARGQALLARTARAWRIRERKLEELAGIETHRRFHPSYVSAANALYGKPPAIDGLTAERKRAS